MAEDGMDTNDNSGTQISSHLHISVKYQYVSGITIFIPTCMFFDTTTDFD
jgi:hypothetical protein